MQSVMHIKAQKVLLAVKVNSPDVDYAAERLKNRLGAVFMGSRVSLTVMGSACHQSKVQRKRLLQEV